MSDAWMIEPWDAMIVHRDTGNKLDDVRDARSKVREAVKSCAASAPQGGVASALQGFWNNQVAVQAQATEAKTSNALHALDALVQNYLAADWANAEIASLAADAVPEGVNIVSDPINP